MLYDSEEDWENGNRWVLRIRDSLLSYFHREPKKRRCINQEEYTRHASAYFGSKRVKPILHKDKTMGFLLTNVSNFFDIIRSIWPEIIN